MSDDEGASASGSAAGHGFPLPSASIQDAVPQDTIKILLATDNHIGYAERDPIRGRDSINTFREILRLAVENDVDMLLLAGDLFHENRPSRDSLYLTIAALREYCLNRRPVTIEVVSDAGMGLGTSFSFPQVNYEDENYNIGLPVFSIHGNHDDPQGVGPDGALCALDILSAAGLVNYFGRQDLPGSAQDDEAAAESGIQIRPVLLQKGRTKLALYGIGNIRDERFHYELRSSRISMFRPSENRDAWFNVMLVHQNRVGHGPKNSVPENGFGDEVDLIVWGHEHDCRIEAEAVPGKEYFITQPGSSIATSLAKGESIKKHVAILEIQDRDFSLTPIPLKTVRPFIFHDLVLSEYEEEHELNLDDKAKVTKCLKKIVKELIEHAKREWEELHADDEEETQPMLPLIRLRVEYTKSDGGAYEVGNPQRFGQEFLNQVANPKDVVQFYRKKQITCRKKRNDIDVPVDELMIDYSGELPEKMEKVQVSTLVHQYLEAQSLGVLAENGMQRAVTVFVEKDDKDAIKEFYKDALKATWEQINAQKEVEEGDMEEHMLNAKEKIAKEYARGDGDERPNKKKGKSKATTHDSSDSYASTDFGGMSVDGSVASTGKEKGKSKVAAKGRGKQLFNDDSDDSNSSREVAPKKSIKKTTASKSPTKKAPAKKDPAKSIQFKLNYSQVPARGASTKKLAANQDEDIYDDRDSPFEVDDSEEEAQPKRKATRSLR